jgi:hypothetical protein
MKKIDNRILEEIARYNSINGYIMEQDATLPPPPAEDPNALPPAPGGAPSPDPVDPNVLPPAPAAPEGPQPVDLSTDPDVEKIGDEGSKDSGSTEEMDITDLVNSQKKIEEKQEEYFDNLFQHLDNLESKLGEMDGIMSKLNDLEMKIEKYREKTPQEKLELRTLDSGPFNQKLSQFFDDKEEDMEKSGKNEYVLTQNDVEDYSPNEIQKTFRNIGDETQPSSFQQLR